MKEEEEGMWWDACGPDGGPVLGRAGVVPPLVLAGDARQGQASGDGRPSLQPRR